MLFSPRLIPMPIQDIAAALEITNNPDLMIFREGVLIFRLTRAIPGASIDDLVSPGTGPPTWKRSTQRSRSRKLRTTDLGQY